ncbi:manganese-dependent inorganic pyrophosphatase [Mollicutes bacterium LVI A0039]|nr:manganese-dependent inorganic pyrophosphatase [Mollicutes bacterium LVI A0039]
MSILIFGHKNPDTDSVISSLVMEEFCRQQGVDAEACMLGEVSLETKYILDYLGVKPPRFIDKVEAGQEVIMVDHNEFGQSVNGIEDATIVRVVDHHRVANFQTASPLDMRLMPVGCTATILHMLFVENNLVIDKKIATMMISSICSDTLLFKSPTTTEVDERVARELAAKFDIDIETYGMEMLKAGTDLSAKTDDEVLSIDSKQFSVGDRLFEVAQVNTADIDELVSQRLDNLVNVMEAKIANDGLGMFLLMITDIVNSNSLLVPRGSQEEIAKFEQNFNTKLENGQVLLSGVVSRKKQIVPNLK